MIYPLVVRSLLMLMLLPFSWAQGSGIQEVNRIKDLKAAFLYNFTLFMDWPMSSRKSGMRFCLLEQDSQIYPRLHSFLELKKSRKAHQATVRALKKNEDARSCDLLYVDQTMMNDWALMSQRQEDQILVTVGNHPQFLKQGGMIRFFVEENRLRFEIHLKLARKKGLRISPELLKLAEIYAEN
jgi:hypothetical protein